MTEKAESTDNKKKNILAVDDEELTRDVLDQALNFLGYSTVTAEDGVTALEKINERKPDLVITDIFMPRMTGVELLKQIRRTDKDLPVILTTGFDAQDAKDAAVQYNARAILLKPFHIKELKTLVEESLGD